MEYFHGIKLLIVYAWQELHYGIADEFTVLVADRCQQLKEKQVELTVRDWCEAEILVFIPWNMQRPP